MSERSVCKRARVSFVVEMSKTSSTFDDDEDAFALLFAVPTFFFAIIVFVAVFLSLSEVEGGAFVVVKPRVEGKSSNVIFSAPCFSLSKSSTHTFSNEVARTRGGGDDDEVE